MNLCKRLFLVLLTSIFVGGCYEDIAEIKLNPDGSGSIKQKFVLSEQLMIASEGQGASTSNVPETTKEALVKKIGTAFNINSIAQKDTPDGGRIIELEGTFDTPEQFFLSEYCLENLKLRLSSYEEGKAAIYCDMSQSNSVELGTKELYGVAKGLFIKRSIQLPGNIEKSNGQMGQNNMVSWATDFRNKETLEKSVEFIDGPDKGQGHAIFKDSSLDFALPLKADDISDESEKGEIASISDSQGLAAKVSYVSVNKKISLNSKQEPELSGLEIGVELTWNKNNCPISCQRPVLINIQDNLNNNLVLSRNSSTFKYQLSPNSKNKELTAKAGSPNPKATKLKNLEGYIEVITESANDKILLDNIQELVGKESTGNPALDALNFKIISNVGSRFDIEIDGGNDFIVSFNLIREDGSKAKRSGGTGWGNNYTYDYNEDISKIKKCEIEVIVSENKVKVPFSIDEIDLP